ncbi:MAG: phosphate acyltransferase PlsX [Gemmatimonadetes bacterium]|nr:phosphate acyltransferase PlsX [Gemmatimonadota bacterium]
MRIVLDAMGTDGAPKSEVAGAALALRELEDDFELVLVGDRAVVEEELARHADFPRERLLIEHAPDRVLPGEAAASVVRKHPECSIVRGLRQLKEGCADAFVSAGSTGAVMAGSLLILRPLEGVDRPAIGTMLPTAREPVLMLDAGANVDCKPHHLVQFAHLGRIYAEDLMGRTNPRVGLLNIGEEPEKGDEVAVEAHQRLAREPGINFVGNVEGRGIILGSCDVLVCDGFVGNVLLKFYESVAQFFVGMLKRGGASAGGELNLGELSRMLDYSEYGGAPLLGVNGVTIICHGGSSPKAIKNAIRVAAQSVRSSMVEHVARDLRAAKEPV